MHRFLDAPIAEHMTRSVITAAPNTPVHALDRLFTLHDFNGFPVVHSAELLGVVTKFDILKQFVSRSRGAVPLYEEIAQRTAEHIMTKDVITFHPDTPLGRVLQTAVDFRVKSFPVVEGRRVVGIITHGDVWRVLAAACRPRWIDVPPSHKMETFPCCDAEKRRS